MLCVYRWATLTCTCCVSTGEQLQPVLVLCVYRWATLTCTCCVVCLQVSNYNLYLLCVYRWATTTCTFCVVRLQVSNCNLYLLCCVSTGEQLQPVPAGSQEGAGGAHGLHQVWAVRELAAPWLCHQRGATPRACSQGCHSNLQSQTVSGCARQLCDRGGGIRIRSVHQSVNDS